MTARRHLLAAVLCILLALWAGLATLVVPALIRSAYRGESLPALNAILEGRHAFPVEHYLQTWHHLALQLTLYGLGYVLLGVLIATIVSSPAFFRKYVGDATPGTLGAIRMLTCVVLLITTSWEDLASVAQLPAEMRQNIGMMGALFALPLGLDRFVASPGALGALQRVTEVLLFLGAIGWLTRLVIPLAAAAHFLVLGILIDYSFFWHQNLVPLYLLAVLSFTPCGDGWSVDYLWRRSRGRAALQEPAAVYGWSRYVCWVVVVLPYVASGLSKLRVGGLSWWNAVNMRGMFYVDNLNAREYAWDLTPQLAFVPDAVLTLLGLATVVVEIAYVLVLFSRAARRILPVMLVMTHLGILLLQRILFFDLILLQLIFYDFTSIRQAVARRLLAGRAGREREGAAAAATASRSAGFQFPLMISGLVLVSIVSWVHRIEFYPLTAWHLYAMLDTSGKIEYYKVLGRNGSSVTSRVRLEEGIGAMALDGRYTPVLEKCFGDPADVSVCEKFLTASGSAYNARKPPGTRLTHFEIQTWTWDFLSNPHHPTQGEMLRRVVVDVRNARETPSADDRSSPSR